MSIDKELEDIRIKYNSLKNENYNLIKQNVDPLTATNNLIGKQINIYEQDDNNPSNEVIVDFIKELHFSPYTTYILTENNRYYNANLIGKTIFFSNGEERKQCQNRKISNREFIRNLKDDDFDMYLYSLFVTGKLYNYIDEGTMYFEDFQEYMSRERTDND